MMNSDSEQQVRSKASALLRAVLKISDGSSDEFRSFPATWIAHLRGPAANSIGLLPEFEDLESALRAAQPDRFEGPWRDYANHYGWQLIEGAAVHISRNRRRGDPDEDSIAISVDELVALLYRSTDKAIAVWLVSDITVAEPTTIGAVELRPVAGLGRSMREVDSIIPGAGSRLSAEIGIGLRMSFHYSLLIGRAEAPARIRSEPGYEAAAQLASDEIAYGLAAIRLATASTAESIFEVRSSPEYVRLHPPEVVPHEHSPYPMIQRIVSIGEAYARPLALLAARVQSWYQDEKNPSTIRIALTRYLRSYLARPWFDIVVDLGIGLEAALLGGADHEEIGLRLRSRAAAILSTPSDPPSRIYEDVKRLYNLRSDIVHGSRQTQKAIDSELHRISTTDRSNRPGEKGALALDRGRDLLRRAILARAFLDERGKWPAGRKGESPDVDGQLAERGTQDEWRSAWRDGLASIGLETAADAASDASLDVALPDS